MRPLYRLYTRVLRRQLAGLPMPRHVAIVMDGNRRWAREAEYDDVRMGHRFGAELSLQNVLGTETQRLRELAGGWRGRSDLRRRGWRVRTR